VFGDLDIEVALYEQSSSAIIIVRDDIETGDPQGLSRRAVELIDAGYRHLIIDISEARRVHWAVVGTMMGLARRLEEHSGRLAVVAIEPCVLHLLRSLGAQENITVLEAGTMSASPSLPLPQTTP
jgi:anti-anti-sigma regulatory factor